MCRNRTILILSMLGVLALALGLDRALDALRKYRTETHNIYPTLWANVAINLVFATSILLLAWLAYREKEKHLPTALTFLVVGLLVLFSATPIAISLRSLLPVKLLRQLPLLISPSSLFAHSGVFIFVMGIYGLLRKR